MQFFDNFQVNPSFAHIIVFNYLVFQDEVACSLMQVVNQSVVNDVGVDKNRLWILDSGLEHLVNEILGHPYSIVINSEVDFVLLTVNFPELDDVPPHFVVIVVGKLNDFNPVILLSKCVHVGHIFGILGVEPQMPLVKRVGLFG